MKHVRRDSAVYKYVIGSTSRDMENRMSLMIPGVSGRCERGQNEGGNTAKNAATLRVSVLCRKGNGYNIPKPRAQKHIVAFSVLMADAENTESTL
jgi:hypothetical protein